MTTVYNLHEFNPDKILSGEIEPVKVVPTKYQQYDINSSGMIIIDKTEDLTYQRKLISLYTEKTKQSKFESVIDINFSELERTPTSAIPLKSNVRTTDVMTSRPGISV